MKKILLATSILAGSAGVAAAEVTFSGNAYMGISNAFDVGSTFTEGAEGDFEFITRVRLKATLSGETDGGLTFGASVESHNFEEAGQTDNSDNMGNATAFIEGSFGKITMGDVGDAPDNLIGNVDGVGLNLEGAKWNELGYIGDDNTGAKYEGTFGDFSVTAAVGQLDANNGSVADPTGEDDQDYSIAVKYSFGDYAVYAGYSEANLIGVSTDETTIGADATFGNFTVKARVQDCSCDADTTWALSATGTFDAISVTAYYADKSSFTAAGIGGSYDLGGGAKFKMGAVQADGAGAPTDETVIDMGLAFDF